MKKEKIEKLVLEKGVQLATRYAAEAAKILAKTFFEETGRSKVITKSGGKYD
ncbi:MAG: hypothetical protein ONB05_08535 [candidate division KSB1 bacterium]|nr:hypothetical protein [candidate division KSB1 bacterium]